MNKQALTMAMLGLAGLSLLGASCNQSKTVTEAEASPQENTRSSNTSITETMESTTYQVNTSKTTLQWEASKVTGKHHGYINIKEGSVDVADSQIIGGKFIIDFASISIVDLTDEKMNKMLSDHLRSDDFFSVDSYPEGSFTITSVEPGEGSISNITGDLVIKGISQPITFPAEISMEGDELLAKATIELDRTRWDIKFRSGKFFSGLGDSLIHDTFNLVLDLKASK